MKDTEVFIKNPEGLTSKSQYFELNRALYCLRNSPTYWKINFNDFITKLDFQDNVYLFLYLETLITGDQKLVDSLI